jgi:hypothetical protein
MAEDEFEYIDDIDVSHHCKAKTFDDETRTWTGRRCRNRIPAGHLVCDKHRGNFPKTRAKAQMRQAEAHARYQLKKKLEREGVYKMEDAIEEMEAIAGEAIAFKNICRERLEALKGDIRYSTAAGEQLRAEVALYERAIDRCDKILTNYVRLGISDRRVKIAEAQALLLVGVIQNVLGRLELSRDQKRIAAVVVPEELRAISGPEEAAP